MELQQLKYFIAVAEGGSFSSAGASLQVAQPKLSRSIRALEEELGARLFFRNGRGVVLSEAGEFLLSRAAEIMRALQTIETGIQSIADNPGGTVRVGLPPSVSGLIGLELLERIAATHGRVSLELEEASTAHILERLYAGDLDIAVLCDAPRCSTLLCQPLTEEELVLACPPTAQWRISPVVRPEMLQGRTVILAEGSCAGQDGADLFPGADLRRVDGVMAAVEFVRKGRGLAVLPAASAAPFAESGMVSLARLPGRPLVRALSMAMSMKVPLSPAALKVSDTLADIIGRALPKPQSCRQQAKLVA